jgi:UDP-N-acetylglucosamine 2-epimerase (non-hydrolysing)
MRRTNGGPLKDYVIVFIEIKFFMASKTRFLCVVGTRPEAIKLAPVILELARHAHVTTLCSGQHTTLAQEPLKWFGITPNDAIKVAKFRTLSMLTAAMLGPMERMIVKHRPDVVLAQGDTTTVLVAALTAFYLEIPFAHVEAGLRTGNLRAPFPEEFNRIAADRLARWRFCPTRGAVANLRGEGIDPSLLYLTGNTGIDALRLALERIPQPPACGGLRRILLTAHRRENQGKRMEAICRAVVALVKEFSDIEFAIPVHPSPTVRTTFERLRVAHDRVQLMPPLSYPRLVAEMARSHLIVTDSGGIQEEAPFLKKPVLVMRDVTERPEAVEFGLARLIGAETASIINAVRELLTDETAYARMAAGGSPYGDGYAAERISASFGLGKRSASAAV